MRWIIVFLMAAIIITGCEQQPDCDNLVRDIVVRETIKEVKQDCPEINCYNIISKQNKEIEALKDELSS